LYNGLIDLSCELRTSSSRAIFAVAELLELLLTL